MQEEALTPDTIMNGEHVYASAQNLIIDTAENELLIFDQDLSHGGFDSLARYELIRKFLSISPNSNLTMILHDSVYFTSYCPRLNELLKTYSHKMSIMLTNDHAKVAKDCFIVADQKHYVKRIHIDQARFKFALNDNRSAASLQLRFNELLDETAYKLAPTQTGL
jgi:hypothetical protein